MESIQQQLEVSLEHSYPATCQTPATVNKERREVLMCNNIGNTQDSVVTVNTKTCFVESTLKVSYVSVLRTYLGTLFH